MAMYIIYDFINDNEIKEVFNSFKAFVVGTNEFYYDTFNYNSYYIDNDYDENKEFKTLNECIELWEGSGFGVARVLKCKTNKWELERGETC